MRFDCSFEMLAAVLCGIVACGGSGVAGSEVSGSGIKLDKLSCDSRGSMVFFSTPSTSKSASKGSW